MCYEGFTTEQKIAFKSQYPLRRSSTPPPPHRYSQPLPHRDRRHRPSRRWTPCPRPAARHQTAHVGWHLDRQNANVTYVTPLFSLYIYTYVCTYVRVCVCMIVCMIYAFTHTHTHVYTQRHTHTHMYSAEARDAVRYHVMR